MEKLKNLRKYGTAPFAAAVIHGGPGAPGEMAPVAKELSTVCGVLEPLQSACSLDGQLTELETAIQTIGDPPITLIGFSWGAMLSFIFTAKCPMFVKKLILVSSGVYDTEYTANIMTTRLARLNDSERAQVISLMDKLNDPSCHDKDKHLTRFGALISKADTYDSFDPYDSYDKLPTDHDALECQFQIYKNVWNDAEKLRQSQKLLELGEHIRCPVLALHGDYDPHPYEGVKNPLSQILKDFRFVLLANCGHRPWIERHARDRFYEILKSELK